MAISVFLLWRVPWAFICQPLPTCQFSSCVHPDEQMPQRAKVSCGIPALFPVLPSPVFWAAFLIVFQFFYAFRNFQISFSTFISFSRDADLNKLDTPQSPLPDMEISQMIFLSCLPLLWPAMSEYQQPRVCRMSYLLTKASSYTLLSTRPNAKVHINTSTPPSILGRGDLKL